MKKLLFCLAAAMAMAGCAVDEPVRPQSAEDKAIARARAFVEAQNPSAQTRGVNKNHPAIEAFEADWSRARVHKVKDKKLTVTEVPTALASPYIYTVLVEQLGQQISLTRQEPHTRILVYEQHGKDKSMSVMLAALLADESWAGDLAELTPRPVNSDFSGVTVYSAADGTPLWGERWDGGTATHDLFFDDKNHGPAAEDLRIAMGVKQEAMTRTDINGGTIDDVVVVGKRPENLEKEDEPDYADGYRGDENGALPPPPGSEDGGGGGGGEIPPKTYTDPTVVVPNGQCVIGSIAAALQAKFGLSDSAAITKATKALQDAGVNTSVVNGGIYMDDPTARLSSTLTSLGFTVSTAAYTNSYVVSHFNNGGFGIGFLDGASVNHLVFLTGYLSGSGLFYYYDPTFGDGRRTGPMNGAILYCN